MSVCQFDSGPGRSQMERAIMAQLCETSRPASTASGALLLVDDDPNHRELYSRRLARLGYSVKTAASADEAVSSVIESMPEAVILDIAMPGRDGLSALQELIAISPSLPVIIHTAYPTFRSNFLTWAADAYVEKSSDLAALVGAIRDALKQRSVA
ncbi:MAG: response regulator [Armatimonadia bacterium]|nr:response regulator [Armatimonadia bacterium]